eukprot:2069693-Rhodomonas_salina.2
MSGSSIAYAATRCPGRVAGAGGSFQVGSYQASYAPDSVCRATTLRRRYAMCGTGIAYAELCR